MHLFRSPVAPLLAAIAGWLGTATCVMAAPGIEAPATILERAEQHLATTVAEQHSGRVEIHMGHLDARLRLTKCAAPLEAFQPSGARSNGPTSVGVRCPDAAGWTVYVPAKVDVFGTALVATRSLAKDSVIRAADVQPREIELSRLGQGHVQSIEDVRDRIMRRSVPAGTVLTPAMLTSPDLIRRGSRVTLVNTVGPIKVEMLGEAIGDAARGERVRVRALDSGEIVEGWVESASVVKVTL